MRSRLWIYLREMYPPLPSALAAVFAFFSLYFILTVMAGRDRLEVSLPALGGALTIFLFLLFLRISDELKDQQSDQSLFPERPLPSGRVLLRDLQLLMAVDIGAMVLLNLFLTQALLAFLVLFGYGLLMLKYFFLPQYISRSLLLALVTHNPSVLLMNFYIIAIFSRQYGTAVLTPAHGWTAVLFWLPALAWELARKIKAPQDENEYETYSRLFGYRLAAWLPLTLLAAHAGMLLSAAPRLGLSLAFQGLLGAGILAAGAFFIRFMLRPNQRTARLKPVIEAYLIATSVGLTVDLAWRRGVALII